VRRPYRPRAGAEHCGNQLPIADCLEQRGECLQSTGAVLYQRKLHLKQLLLRSERL